ncbi:histone-lysine N-methyltransferase SUV39H2-like isoform X1 [Cloeon dipterum]|uniref:histone-lysine N-methyltransferase SUV39H2-like isoform X1 n=1 Tax=Cloeon dipterum TaxID=197152 RepID=UPI0032205117
MEKGKASRDCDTENALGPDEPMADKSDQQEVRQQMIDGRIQCTVSTTESDKMSQESGPSNGEPGRKRNLSTSSSGNSVSSKKRKRKRMGAKQKERKARNPFYSIDARDTETREVPANAEKPDLTVGLTVLNEYEVESIEDRMVFEDEFHYLVKWKGWAPEHNSWEPKSGLKNARLLIRKFEKKYPELLQARFLRISEQLPVLEPLGGKATLYECEVVAGMTIADYNTIFKLPKHEEPLPNPKLLKSHIFKVLQDQGNDNLLAMIKRMVLKREQVRIQFEQQAFMKNFIKKLNEVSGNELLSIENNVDLGFPPLSFQPISKNVAHEEIVIPEDPPVGCECDTCDNKAQCCPQLADVNFAYNSRGLLEINYGNPIFECNKACKCPDSCINRVVQKGSQLKLKIFKTEDKGWGVQAREYIPQGTFVCEYVGEMIARWVVHQRTRDEYKGKSNYIFDLDFNPTTEQERFDSEGYEILPYSVDATVRGNVSHFINHSCEPNLGVYGVFVDCLDPHMPRLGMFAIRDIQCGDEIFFDYTAQYLLKRRKKGPKSKRSVNSAFACKCGSSVCRSVEF